MKSAYLSYNRFPIDHMDDNDTSKYFLQLNFYRYILETYYDTKIDQMQLVVLHPDLLEAKIIEVPVLENEIRSIIQHSKTLE